jgi:hypothetical protein
MLAVKTQRPITILGHITVFLSVVGSWTSLRQISLSDAGRKYLQEDSTEDVKKERFPLLTMKA